MLIDPNDIVHFMITDPANPFWGISPLKAAARLLDTESDALTWWRWSIRNRAAKDGFIQYPRLLSPNEYNRVKSRLYEQVAGPYNSRLPMILTGDAKWVPSSSTAVEMDFVDLRKMTREELCILYGVDPILVGIADKATYSNKKEARLTLWQDRLIGVVDSFRSGMDIQLLPDFVPRAQLRRYRTNVDLSRVPALLQHLADLSESVSTYYSMGWTPNELNTRFGLGFKNLPPDIGDRSWISNGVTRAETPEEEAEREKAAQQESMDQALARMAGEAETDNSRLEQIAAGKPSQGKPRSSDLSMRDVPAKALPPGKGIYFEA
jgi:hypothetical protein